jgi:hypothetical protein
MTEAARRFVPRRDGNKYIGQQIVQKIDKNSVGEQTFSTLEIARMPINR